jgi:hypothetical protein
MVRLAIICPCPAHVFCHGGYRLWLKLGLQGSWWWAEIRLGCPGLSYLPQQIYMNTTRQCILHCAAIQSVSRCLTTPCLARMWRSKSLVCVSTACKQTIIFYFIFWINESVPGSGTAREQAPQGHKLPVLLPSPGARTNKQGS